MKPTRQGLANDGKFLLIQLLGIVLLCNLAADPSIEARLREPSRSADARP